jgi:hypothetical protein
MNEFFEQNTVLAITFDNSVLPTPVEPRKMNDAEGRFGSLIPILLRRIAFAISLIASF